MDRASVGQKDRRILLVGDDVARRDQARLADAHGAADRVEGGDGEDRGAGLADRLRLFAEAGLAPRRRRGRREQQESQEQRPHRKPGAGGGKA